jgi:hypothetical protein
VPGLPDNDRMLKISVEEVVEACREAEKLNGDRDQ